MLSVVGNAQMSDTWQKCPLSSMTTFIINNNAVNELSLPDTDICGPCIPMEISNNVEGSTNFPKALYRLRKA